MCLPLTPASSLRAAPRSSAPASLPESFSRRGAPSRGNRAAPSADKPTPPPVRTHCQTLPTFFPPRTKTPRSAPAARSAVRHRANEWPSQSARPRPSPQPPESLPPHSISAKCSKGKYCVNEPSSCLGTASELANACSPVYKRNGQSLARAFRGRYGSTCSRHAADS